MESQNKEESGSDGQIEEEESESSRKAKLLEGQVPQQDQTQYINQLENHLSSSQLRIRSILEKNQKLQSDLKAAKDATHKVRFQFLSSKQQFSALKQEKESIENEIEKIKTQNQKLKEKLQAFDEIGDVTVFKNKVTQLEGLIKIQKQEIALNQKIIQESPNESTGNSQRISTLKILDRHESENKLLRDKVSLSDTVIASHLDQIQTLTLKIEELSSTITHQNGQLTERQNKIADLQKELGNRDQELAEMTRKMKENVSYDLQASLKNSLEVQEEVVERYQIKILTPEEERDIILRKFIDLEIENNDLKDKNAALKQRHYKVLKEVKLLSSHNVAKSEYAELFQRYTRLRKCLQNSLVSEQTLKTHLSNVELEKSDQCQGQGQRQGISRFKALISEEPQNPMNQIEQILGASRKNHSFTISAKEHLQQKQQILRIKKEITEKQKEIMSLSISLGHAHKTIELLDSQIGNKSREIESLKAQNEQGIEKVIELQKQSVRREDFENSQREVGFLKSQCQIYEIKALELLRTCNSLRSQKQMFSQLYQEIKAMYEDLVSRRQTQQKESQHDLQNKEGTEQAIKKTHLNEKGDSKENEAETIKNLTSFGLQTENLSDLYFREIKELLTILKKLPKIIDRLTAPLEKEKTNVAVISEEFKKGVETLDSKKKQLEQQKKANEKWRADERQKIKGEFQEIRELIVNERLLKSLRSAKSLIEYYETNAEAEGEQEGEAAEEEDNKKAGNDEISNNKVSDVDQDQVCDGEQPSQKMEEQKDASEPEVIEEEKPNDGEQAQG